MGDDPSMSAQTKYALVCGGCFRHNGLVGGGKEEWENTSELGGRGTPRD